MLSNLDYRIIYALKDFDVVNANVIADNNSVSVGTIRREIKIINQEIEENGLCIKPESSKGFVLVLKDPEKGKQFLETVMHHVNRHQYSNQSDDYISFFIIRKLLIKNDYASIEGMCDEIGYSKSTVIKHIPRIKNYLSLYNLKLVSVRNRGSIIEGNEWDKRMCMIAQVRYYLQLPKEFRDKEEAFRATCFRSSSFQDTLYYAIIDEVNQHDNYTVPFLLVRKIAHLITVCDSRRYLNDDLSFPGVVIQQIHSGIEYEIARSIYHRIGSLINNEYSDIEITMVTFFLAGFRCITSIDELSDDDKNRLAEEAETILNYLKEHVYLPPAISPKNIEYLACFLYSFHYRVILQIEMEEELIVQYRNRNPFILDVCRCFSKYYLKEKSLAINENDAISAYPVFSLIIDYYHSLMPAVKIMISSVYGHDYELLLKKQLLDKYPKQISKVDSFESNNTIDDSYDLFISDYQPAKYRVEIPENVASYVVPVASWNFDDLMSSYKDHYYSRIIKQMFRADCMIECDVSSKEEFLTLVSNSFTNEDHSKLYRDLLLNDSLISNEKINGLAFVRLPIKTAEPLLKVYTNANDFLWGINDVKTVILYNYGQGYHNFYAINEFLKNFKRYGKKYVNRFVV